MSDIGPQRAAPSSAARVEAQHRDAVKEMNQDVVGELNKDKTWLSRQIAETRAQVSQLPEWLTGVSQDDGQAPDDEWLLSIGFEPLMCGNAIGLMRREMQIEKHRDGRWVVNCLACENARFPTRGHVRRLIAALSGDVNFRRPTAKKPDKRGELFADCVMREMLSAAIQRLRSASIEASVHDPDEPDIAAGMRIAYAEPPELTVDGWMCADISVVCEFARHAFECGLSMPKKQGCVDTAAAIDSHFRRVVTSED